MIDFGLVSAADAEAIGVPGERTFRLRAITANSRVAFWMEKEQLATVGRGISRLLAERAGQRTEAPAEPAQLDDFGGDADVDVHVVRLGLDFETDSELVIVLADDREALERGDTPAFRMEISREVARRLVSSISQVVAAGRPLCPLCGRPLEGDGQHFCPGSNGHSAELDIPEAEVDET